MTNQKPVDLESIEKSITDCINRLEWGEDDARDSLDKVITYTRSLEVEVESLRERVTELEARGDDMAKAITDMNSANCRPDVRGGFMEQMRTLGNALSALSKWEAIKEPTKGDQP